MIDFAKIALVSACMLAAGSASADESREMLYQVSTIQALTAGDYHASISVKDLLKHGDTGLGTFENLDGEMIVLEGTCYQARGDGSVSVCNPETGVPFAAVTFADKDAQFEFSEPADFDAVKAVLDAKIKELGRNSFYAAVIEGDFSLISYRSELKQSEPYRPLDKVMESDQRFFELKNAKGTIVALYVPKYAGGINAAGWHLHFLEVSKKNGGHIIGFNMSSGSGYIDKTDSIRIDLPDTGYFSGLDLESQDDAVGKVERGEGNR